MTTPSWRILYNEALQAGPVSVLQTNRIAVEAILERMKDICLDAQESGAKTQEQCALVLALSDLRVIRISAVSALL